MKSALDRIKSLLVDRDFGQHYDYFLFSAGEIRVTNGRVSAGAPSAHAIEALVPGAELLKLLSRLEEPIDIKTRDGFIELRSGRYHGTIQTLSPDALYIPLPDDHWSPLPAGLVEALRVARPFVASTTTAPIWANAYLLQPGRIIATTTYNLLRVDLDLELPGDGDVLLPNWAGDFLVASPDAPERWIVDANHAAFIWADGSWITTQLIAAQYDRVVVNLLDQVADIQPVAISTPWRADFEAVAFLSESLVTITPTHITGRQNRGVVQVETDRIDIHAPIHFDPAILAPAIKVATSWGPGCYPAPVPFAGPGVRGLVAGRSL